MSRFINTKNDISFTFDEKQYKAKEGDNVACALFENSILINRGTYKKTPRGSFCYMGVCFECLVNIDGQGGIQACKVELKDGMDIKSDE